MLSKKTKYAIHALTYLAKSSRQTPVIIREIAQEYCIPQKFLESILLELKKAGFLGSKIGKGGGYYLTKDPKKIKMAHILRMFNGPIALLPCVSLNYYESCAECVDEKQCGLHKMALEVRDAALKILLNKSLGDIVAFEELESC